MTKKRYDSTRQWYAIHTYSGYEEKVADSIRQRIQAVDMAESSMQSSLRRSRSRSKMASAKSLRLRFSKAMSWSR